MILGVISDTHLRTGDDVSGLSALVESGHLSEAELILHAGDHVELDLIELALAPKRIISVRGNMDYGQAAELPTKRVLEFEGKKIGLIHGWGSPTDMAERVCNEFCEDGVDIIIFGHSHRPFSGRVKGVLLFNPGSPTDKRFAPYNSIGVIELKKDEIEAKIIKLG